MTLQELQDQILQLPISDRLSLVQSVLESIEQETLLSISSPSFDAIPIADLDPWTKSLLGVIQLSPEDTQESYIDYLEEKYQ